MPQLTPISSRTRLLAGLLLAGLFLILAVRLSSMEELRETLAQKSSRLSAPSSPEQAIPFTGPPVLFAEAGFTFFIAAAAAAMLAFSAGLARVRLAQFALLAGILVALTLSSSHAANRFNAFTGLADLAMALAAGWALTLLLALLGDAGRRVTIAALLALLTLWLAKGFLQKFVEMPDTVADYQSHRAESLRAVGISPDDAVRVKLFESRLNSGEVTGFLSFSNVFAAGLAGLLSLLAGVLTSQVVAWIHPAPSPPASTVTRRRPDPPAAKPGQIPLNLICFVLGTILFAAGLFLLPLTGSMGGATLGFAACAAAILAGFFSDALIRHRRRLIVLVCGLLVLGAGAGLFYGIRHDALPGKSLTFRWHYWTASLPMIEAHPAAGVGLNNFGDYYTQFKRPSSPEDVKDPHNFLVRLAAETGLPAMLLIAVLLALMLGNALRPARAASPPLAAPAENGDLKMVPPMTLAVVVTLFWAGLHFLISEPHVEFSVYTTLIFAAVALGAFALFLALLNSLSQSAVTSLRYMALAGVIGAAAMFIYDQINMALVAGPVAMLFWMLLALGDAPETPAASDGVKPRPTYILPTLIFAATAVAFFLAPTFFLPSIDPAPLENAYLQRLSVGSFREARQALEAAIARAPNSVELRMLHIRLLREHFADEPVAGEIRAVLNLDKANADIRVGIAMREPPPPDLTASDRVAMLRQALKLDSALPADELKRLSPAQIEQIQKKISELTPPQTTP